jgi:hypothetical protein
MRAVLGLLFGVMTCVIAQPAQASDAIVQVVLDSLLPIVPSTSATLTLTGRVVNSSTTSVSNPKVQLRLSPTPISGRLGIDSESNSPTTATRTAASIDLRSSIAPNAQMSFKFSLPFQQLLLNRYGTYALAVDVEDAGKVIGSIRTFLPWYPSVEKSPRAIGVVWLWPLADYPARTASNVLLNNQTPAALSPGGRLTHLVDVGREFSSTLSWMIDPSLVQTADAIGRGYQVVQDGEVVVGNQSTDATQWLNELRSSISSSNAHALAYAGIDAVADRKNGLSADVVRAITVAQPITTSIVKSPIPGGMYWAPNGQLDQKTANLLASAGTTTAVLSTSAMASDTSTPRQGLADYETTFGNINAVLTEDRLSTAIALPQRTASEIIVARQRFLAETAAIADSPAALTNTQLTVVAAPTDLRWSPAPSFLRSVLRATQSASWMIPTTLESLLNSPRGAGNRLAYVAGSSELTSAYLSRLKAVQAKVSQLTAVQRTPGPVNASYAEALLRAQSAAWRTEPGTGAALLTAISSELNAQINQVRPISSGTITFSGDSGKVPVTLANDSDSVVNVGLSLIGVPRSRLEAVPETGIVIEPGQKISVEIPVRIVGGDPLPTKVQVLTPKGQAYGTPATIVLGSTAYARAAGWVVATAFGAIAIFVVVGITRRIVQARKSDE